MRNSQSRVGLSLLKGIMVRATLLAFLLTGITVPTHAGVLTTQDYLSGSARVEHLQTIDAALLRADVRQQLIRLGVEPEAARSRIAGLPDEDLERLAGQMEELPAGGSLLALVGAVFVVLLILELTGVINIFNKV